MMSTTWYNISYKTNKDILISIIKYILIVVLISIVKLLIA